MTGYSTYFTALTATSGGGGGATAGPVYGVVAASVDAGTPVAEEIFGSPQNAFPTPRLRTPVPGAGIFRRFVSNVTINTLTAVSTWEVLLNGVGTALVTTYLAGETGVKSIDFPVPVLPGFLVSFRITSTAAGAEIMVGNCSVEFS